jgi:hypothetical protein
MQDVRIAFLEAVKQFPSWMDIRKRPFKSIGGHFLRSIIEEQEDIQRALVDFKKDFFIISYIGREHTVIDYLYAVQVGDVGDNFTLTSPVAQVTTNAKAFYQSIEPIALWQEGYLLFRLNLISESDLNIRYTIDDFAYSAPAVKFHVWNVLDEFAMFSGLERYDGETNAELLKRTLLAYKNPTNSTELGLKNAIINSISNYASIDLEDITIEAPNENNLALPDDEFGTLYERLAQFNKDVFRTKKWDMDTWEHNFKTLEYLPHVWDVEIDDYQNGVGQNNALQTILVGELQEQETTDVQITGYQKSDIQINEYIRSKRIETDLDLTLKKYDNLLKAKEVEYKITASEVKEVPIADISLECYKQALGEGQHYLADLVTEVRGATVVSRGVLAPKSKYRVKFYPASPYTNMLISKADLVKPGGQADTLLTEDSIYKKVNGVFQNTDVALHATSTKQFKIFNSVIDVHDGVTIDSSAVAGSFAIDITGMGGKLLKLGYTCRPVDITKNTAFVKPNGFILTSDDKLVASGTDSTSNIVIELDCNYIAWELETAANASQQGSCTVIVRVDDKVDTAASGLWSSGRKIERSFNKMSRVKIEIQKSGMNPVVIKDIMASRYEVSCRTEKGSIIITPFSSILPTLAASERNTLYVDIKAYSAFAPIVNYVHIGASLGNAVYVAKDIVTGTGGYSLDISSNCIVKLYKINGTTEVLESGDLATKPSYYNGTTNPVSLILDTSRFLTITRSTPTIERTTEAGSVVNFITLQPGQSLDKITIEGSSLILMESTSLHKLICPTTGNYKAYVSKALKGFILQAVGSLEESLVHLTRDNLNGFADVFRLKNLPLGITGSFIIDKSNKVETIGNSFDQSFEELYLFPTESQEYIAYNKIKALKSIYQGVNIVDTFMPLIPPNSSVVYTIDGITNSNLTATALFEKLENTSPSFKNWSLGPKTIRVEVDMGHGDKDSYELELKQLNQKFIVSNNIDLDAEYEVEGQTIELAQYIIIPPAKMKVIYETKDYSKKIVVEEDGFNKLHYSNIEFVSKIIVEGVTIPTSSYELMGQQGIIVWKNDDYEGKEAEIYYKYRSPKYLAYSSLEHLYALVGYSIEAYRVINAEPIALRNLSDGSIEILDFGMLAGQYPDKVITRCDNPNFQAKVEDGNILRVTKVNTDNVVAIKTGFFYEDGLEYYQFNTIHTDSIDRMSNIELHNVRRLGDSLVFIQKSTNHLLDSAMRVRHTGELSNIDFINNKGIRGISRINSLTACDSYNCWIDFDMGIAFKTGINGMALEFKANSGSSYAIMDISRFVKPNTLVTLSASGPITVQIAKEIKYRDSSYSKAIFAEPYAPMRQGGSYQYFVFDDCYEQDSKYFLLLTGSGVLDDIVIKDYIAEEQLRAVHTKNIDLLDLDIPERPKVNYVHRLLFDVNGNQFNNLELDYNGKLQTGANVDWGLTKIYDVRNSWSSCILTDVKAGKEAMYSQDEVAIIETPAIYLRNKQSIKNLTAKVNDVMVDGLTGFKITILSSDQSNGRFNEVNSLEGTNTLQTFRNKLLSYVKVRVEMPANRVINNIEVFAEYAEIGTPLRITTNRYGDMITKVYDTGYMAKFKVRGLDVKELNLPDKIRIQIRACREDAEHAVWTTWKDLRLDSSMKAIGDALVFEDYRLFQFKICLDDELAKIVIGSFNFEVVG